ncbi:MAG: response regulator, partial [Chthoniobacterales bacterium]
MPPPPPSSAGTEGSILLVEEYDALSAAIASALKKFALGRPILTASSLAAAERVIEEENPALLVVDFDPPLAGALAFFNRLRSVCPETRVLIMATGLPVEVLRHRRAPVAFHFMEKPFQLAEFGHAISSLLGGVPLAAGDAAPGRARDMSVVDVALLHALAGATESVTIQIPGDERVGEIHFEKGNIRHAQASGLVGIDALRELARWSKPDFTAGLRETAVPETIEGNWTAVLLQVLRSIPLPPTPKRHRAAAAKDARTILVIDDTETLRDFVEEMLATSNPNLRIETAATGTDGVQRCLALQPDLILLDYSLPDINGDEVCRQLAADENASRIPIIMMSGHVAQMAMSAAQYPNIVATLSKPFVSAVLIDAVTKVLNEGAAPKGRKPAADSPLAAGISAVPRNGKTAQNGHAVTPPLAPPVSSPPVPADPETVSTSHQESTALPIPEEVLL